MSCCGKSGSKETRPTLTRCTSSSFHRFWPPHWDEMLDILGTYIAAPLAEASPGVSSTVGDHADCEGEVLDCQRTNAHRRNRLVRAGGRDDPGEPAHHEVHSKGFVDLLLIWNILTHSAMTVVQEKIFSVGGGLGRAPRLWIDQSKSFMRFVTHLIWLGCLPRPPNNVFTSKL